MTREKRIEQFTTENIHEGGAAFARETRIAQLVAEDACEIEYGEASSVIPRPGAEFYARQSSGEVDSLDDFQPVPRAGKFFAELIVRNDMQLDSGVIVPGADREIEEDSAQPKRARVVQLGPPRDEPWDFKEGWEVVLPYHAGHHFTWLNQAGIEESLWIVDTNEVIAVFRPRSQPAEISHLCQKHLATVQRGFRAGQIIEQCDDSRCEFAKK